MPRLSKWKKQIKELAKRKKEKSSKDIPIFDDFDILEDESDESDGELIWNDQELDEKADNFVKILSDRMKNYVPPACKSIYTGNSIRTKKRKKAKAKRLAAQNGQTITKFLLLNSLVNPIKK